MKVLMIPGKGEEGDRTSGISAVVHKYVEYLEKEHDVIFVNSPAVADLIVAHAGTTRETCDVAIIHGLYWTGDYNASRGEFMANADIVESVRAAQEITVPSEWVRKVFQRDMHVSPTVIYHAVEADEWKHNYKHQNYILWNKNRPGDVCSPTPMMRLAKMFPEREFITTFTDGTSLPNVKAIGKQDHEDMRKLVQKAGVYLSLVKETFGIGVLEAMASGCPILGWDYGGNQVLVEHGVNGYLAEPGNYNDLAQGLEYCTKHAKVLGKNSTELAKKYSWSASVDKLYEVLEQALEKKHRKNTTTFVIPVYNYAHSVSRAIESVCEQTEKPHEIIVVDDGSTDNPKPAVMRVAKKYPDINIKYIRKANGGVASARNLGVQEATGKYICCLDADDAVDPEFLATCTKYLEKNPSVYTAYTSLRYIKPDGEEGVSKWPAEYSYDGFLHRQNQVPTCNVSRREVWERLGGQRGKYSPVGAGSEDAEMWLRAGAAGMGAALVTQKPLFVYSWMSGLVSGNPEYREVDWLADHPWTADKLHPFASCATPASISHKVFQYDLPKVSVIIPCGVGHEEVLRNALDSLEAQTLRHWEAVVVYDNDIPLDERTRTAFPFAEFYITGGNKGAAFARNLGVKHAKADTLYFLDADDELLPTALAELYEKHSSNVTSVIYSDYILRIKDEDEELIKNGYKNRLLRYDKRNKRAYVRFKSLPYDCQRAQKQPVKDNLYEWTTVSVMLSKQLHNKIGGFDEQLATLEDVDYHWRLAHKDTCYVHIEKELLIIDANSGLNEQLKRNHDKAITQIIDKYIRGAEMSPCGGCGKSAVVHPNVKQTLYNTAMSTSVLSMSDENFVLALYTSKNIGNHRIVGAATKIDYGYHQGGQQMLVHREDMAVSPNLFQAIPVEETETKETPPPELIEPEEKE